MVSQHVCAPTTCLALAEWEWPEIYAVGDQNVEGDVCRMAMPEQEFVELRSAGVVEDHQFTIEHITLLQETNAVLNKARLHSLEALDTAIELMRDPSVPPATRLNASLCIMERAWGKTAAQNQQQQDGVVGVPALRIEFISSHQHTEREPQLEGKRVVDLLPFDPSLEPEE